MRYTQLMEPSRKALQEAADASALVEMRSDEWVILPATMALYNRRTVDIVTAASEWQPSPTTILVCAKEENGKARFCFVSSAGDAFDSYKGDVGKMFHAVHDQTRASKGYYKLLNVVVVANSEIVKSLNNTGLNAKASLSVFK